MERSISTYYTPEIEEMHVGFEFELIDNPQGDFTPYKIVSLVRIESLDGKKWGILTELPQALTKIRVKYLDRDDIEGEGWDFTGRSIDIWFKISCNETPGGRNKLTHLTMHYNVKDHEMKITAFFGDTDEGCLFEGFILNLSEFRKLMKQLNIKKP